MADALNFPALLIDTSTRYLVCARVDSNTGFALQVNENLARNEDAIDLAVDRLFPDLGNLRAIWLGQGPGSFVGLRSSFAYARMLVMLRQLDCRTFWSSLLWRQIFSVPESAWFLTRTNAQLFYADRFTADREAAAIGAAEAAALEGDVYCFSDSWKQQHRNAAAVTAEYTIGTMLHMADVRLQIADGGQEKLRLSDRIPHNAVQPVYGHELNLKLAKGN